MSFQHHPGRVLCYSSDPRLLETRSWVLERRYEVVSVDSLEAMKSLGSASEIDIVVLCHTLSKGDYDAASSYARRSWPGAKIVSLTSDVAHCSPASSDRLVYGLDGPRVLLTAIESLLAAAGIRGGIASIR